MSQIQMAFYGWLQRYFHIILDQYYQCVTLTIGLQDPRQSLFTFMQIYANIMKDIMIFIW